MLIFLRKLLLRYLLLALCFFLPQARKVRLERWLRGREEYYKLQHANAVIVSFGKSGRTWLRVMISRFYTALYGLDKYLLMGFDNLHRKNHAIPRLFFSHDNYLKYYTGNIDSKADFYHKKVVLLVRNPMDIAVSQFFQWKYRMRPHKKALNGYPAHGSDILIYDFMLHPAGLPRIVNFLNQWIAESEKIKQLHIIRYEDMRADAATELRKLMNFLGSKVEQAAIDEAVNFSSIDNMRAMETKSAFWLSGSRMKAKDKSNPNSYKVRKAKVGGYRDYFDDQQLSTLTQWVAERINPKLGYFTFTDADKTVE